MLIPSFSKWRRVLEASLSRGMNANSQHGHRVEIHVVKSIKGDEC